MKHDEIYNEVLGVVEQVMGIPKEMIFGKDRHRDIMEARHIAATLLVCCGITTTRAGKMINRDHATIVHSTKTIKNRLSVNDCETITNFMLCGAKVSHLLKKQPTESFLNLLESEILLMESSFALAVIDFCQRIRQMLGIIILVDTLPCDMTRETLMHNVEVAIASKRESDQNTGKVLLKSMEAKLLSI